MSSHDSNEAAENRQQIGTEGMKSSIPLTTTSLPYPSRCGKVRDVYDLGTSLLIVSTDRISAFDWVLPDGIPDKGRVLTRLSEFWFKLLDVENHLLSVDLPTDLNYGSPSEQPELKAALSGRVMVAKKAEVIPFECVVRGYLEGSGWREYQETGEVCGIKLPKGLKQCSALPEPIFTPATKADEGHDENVSFETMAGAIGAELAEKLRSKSLEVFQAGNRWASERGIIIADTKFEWGWHADELILIDEVLTPDSSRFWPMDDYEPGRSQRSFDKQFVREWLMTTDWDRQTPPPALPQPIVEQTREKYLEVLQQLTDKSI